jgi:hypothetical protein
MINLMNLPAEEAERLAYAEGFTGTAELFARVAALEAERDALQAQLDDIPTESERNQDAQDLEHLKQFFYDCFERLAGHYPCPEFSSDYDKSVILAAIERGESCEANHGDADA